MNHSVVRAVSYATGRFLVAMLRLILYYVADSKLAFTTGIECEGFVLLAHVRLDSNRLRRQGFWRTSGPKVYVIREGLERIK